MIPRAPLILLCGILLVGSGCASSRNVSINEWQQDVEHYVRIHDSDPTVLGEVTLPRTHRAGFAAIGSPESKSSTDVFALLLAHRVIETHPWFIYLAASSEREEVKQIRLAALSVRSAQFVWKLGPADESSLHTYLGTSERAHRTFPQEGDTFDVVISGPEIVATHLQSGARWVLNLHENRENSRTARASE